MGFFSKCGRKIRAPLELQCETGVSSEVAAGELSLISNSGAELGFFSSCVRKFGVPLEFLWESQGSSRVATGESGLVSS